MLLQIRVFLYALFITILVIKMKYLISACLANQPVRYDGKGYFFDKISKLLKTGDVVTACPEVFGGMPTPRLAAEIINGTAKDVLNNKAQVIDQLGNDVTKAFIDGAYKTLKLAQHHQVSVVVLKENSPSCGSHFIYDGTFSGHKIIGTGITTTLLQMYGFKVISENEFLSQFSD